MKRQNEILVGLLTVVAVAILLAGTYWLSRGSFRSGYPLYTVVDWGQGLKTGQNVLFAGVAIGYVDNVELKPEGKLVIAMRIEKQYQVPVGSEAAVEAASIFGDMLVAIKPLAPGGAYFAEGDTIPSGKAGAGINEVIANADSVSRALTALLSGIQQELVSAGTIAELRTTLARTGQLVTTLGEVAQTQSRELSETMGSLRNALAAVDSARVAETMTNIQLASKNLEGLTVGLQQTGSQLGNVMSKLEGTDGTAGKLLNDPALYDELRQSVVQLQSLLGDFQANPKRYLDFRFSIFGGRR